MDGRSKFKSFDILLSTQRGIGKISLIELITKIYMSNPARIITDFVGKYPDVNSYSGQICIQATSLSEALDYFMMNAE